MSDSTHSVHPGTAPALSVPPRRLHSEKARVTRRAALVGWLALWAGSMAGLAVAIFVVYLSHPTVDEQVFGYGIPVALFIESLVLAPIISGIPGVVAVVMLRQRMRRSRGAARLYMAGIAAVSSLVMGLVVYGISGIDLRSLDPLSGGLWSGMVVTSVICILIAPWIVRPDPD